MREKLYLIGSLRHAGVRELAAELRGLEFDVFDDWHAAGPEADDIWRDYEKQRGRSYLEALDGYHAKHVFALDYKHLSESEVAVLALPCGKSGHLEFGWHLGHNKRGYILLEDKKTSGKLTEQWHWLTGIYEGEGSITRNGKREGHGLQLTVSMKDLDIIRRLHRVSGVGTVEGPYIRKDGGHSAMWRWSVRKRAEVLYVARGMWEHLGERRQQQFVETLMAAGLSDNELFEGENPKEYRYDVMYQFATGVFAEKEELFKELLQPGQMRVK